MSGHPATISEWPARAPARACGLIGWLFGLTLVGLLILAVVHFGDVEDFGRALRRAQPWWLIAALVLQTFTYVSVSLGWSTVLSKASSPTSLRRLIPIAVAKLFADQMIPMAGMGGNMLLVDRLVALGVPRSAAVAVLLVSTTGYYAVYAVLAVAAWGLLWINGKASLPIDIVVALLLCVALAIPGSALWLRRRGHFLCHPSSSGSDSYVILCTSLLRRRPP